MSALGLQTKDIQDSQLTATSSQDALSGPSQARLFNSKAINIPNTANTNGAWIAGSSGADQYLSIELGAVTKITGIATQGASGFNYWVKTYKLQYSTKPPSWTYYTKVSNSILKF